MRFILIIVLLPIAHFTSAQDLEKKILNVAILVHEGVELFDFAGPGEVFSVAGRFSDLVGFNVYTVASSEAPITSQTFLSVNPNFSVDNCPKPDIIILPGGQTGKALKDIKIMEWVEKSNKEAEVVLTVCTGAFIAEKAGLLEHKRATTHWGSTFYLSQKSLLTEVLINTKYVDSGKIITSGGVSSGIEGSLHLVQRLAGRRVAEKVARYMEYDKWKPGLGIIDYQNPYLEDRFLNEIKKATSPEKILSVSFDYLYYGELELAGYDLLESGDIENAINVFEYLVVAFPDEHANFTNLAAAYQKAGKPSPRTQSQILELLEAQKFNEATDAVANARKLQPTWVMLDENILTSRGYDLLTEKKYEEAIETFKLIIHAFPKSANAHDSLGEGYMLAGDTELSIMNYKKSLELNPSNENARNKIEELLESKN